MATFTATGLFEMFSLIEWLILGFIGANLTLSGVFLVQSGIKSVAATSDE